MSEYELVYQPEARQRGNRRMAAGLQRGKAAQIVAATPKEYAEMTVGL